MIYTLPLLLALLSGVANAASDSQAPIGVGSVSVHLFFSPSGEFSEDVAALPNFESWNFHPAVPVQPVDEYFSSFIVKIRLTAGRSVYKKGRVATVTVRSIERRKVLYTSDISNLYIPESGERVIAKLIEGHVCEPIEILVAAGKNAIRKKVNFQCGE